MRILFLTSGTIKSSLSYRPLSFAKELVKNGHEVFIIAPRFDKYSNFIDEKVTLVDGVKIIRPLQIKTSSFELGLIPYIISSIYLSFKLNPTIVHIFKPNPITIGGLLLKLIKKTPVILDVDDLDSEVMKIENNSKLKVKLVEISERIALRHSSGITVASTFLQKLYTKTNKPISRISNGAEFNVLKKQSAKSLLENTIVFIGNINRINILEPLFYATQKLVNKKIKISVKIIGSGEYLNYFKKLAKKLKLEKNILFLGYVKQSELNKYIFPGDIGYSYMPNELTIKACSSMKVFQYMQFGAIPLVSNVGDFPLYVYQEKAGYIAKSNNIDALTETIQNTFENKTKRIEKLTFGIENTKKDYQWSILSDKLEKFYKKLL
ncbi:MAG TPA: glycosyltransferase [Patescibacteria group bacterium]